MTDFIIDEVKNNFKIVKPDVGLKLNSIKDSHCAEYRELCNQKEIAFRTHYPQENEILLATMANLGGQIGGVNRRMRSKCIIELLRSLKFNNTEGFERFSVTCYEELSKYLFNVSPSRDALIELVNDRDCDGRITKNGQNIAEAISELCSQHSENCDEVRKIYDDCMTSYQTSIKGIKSQSDKAIKALKKRLKKGNS